MNASRRIIEICCADSDSIKAAVSGGADRIELCSALSEGGITPSDGMIRHAVASGLPVNVLIRPRGGDFVYTTDEVDIMCHDISVCGAAGAHGVVIGALTVTGDVDMAACHRMIDTARSHSLSITFHRAFDLCRNPFEQFDRLIDLGVDRLLTSGQAPSALKGAEMLRALVMRSTGRIRILAGAGVTAENAAEIIRLTGVTELHASAKTTIQSKMNYRHESVKMGSADSDEYSRQTTSPELVARLSEIIHDYEC